MTYEHLAKGIWQREIVRRLESGERIANPAMQLKGRAMAYSSHYARSLDNLVDRMKDAGAVIVDAPGPKGGWGIRLEA